MHTTNNSNTEGCARAISMPMRSFAELRKTIHRAEMDEAQRRLASKYPRLGPACREAVAREAVSMMHRHGRRELSNNLLHRAMGVWLRHKVLPYDQMCNSAAELLGTDRLPEAVHRKLQSHFMAIVVELEREFQALNMAL